VNWGKKELAQKGRALQRTKKGGRGRDVDLEGKEIVEGQSFSFVEENENENRVPNGTRFR